MTDSTNSESDPNGRALTVGRVVDWDFAAAAGARLARPGPATTEYTRRQVFDELADASRRAELPVREVTGLHMEGSVPAARIVDRPGWIRLAAQSMRDMTGGSEKPSGFLRGRATGLQTGAVLAFVSAGILGQYDPFTVDEGSDEPLGRRAEGSDEPLGRRAEGSDEPLGRRAEGSDEPLGRRAEGSDEPLGRRAEGSDEPLGRRAEGSDEPLGRRAEGSDEPLGRRAEGSDEPLGRRASRRNGTLLLVYPNIISVERQLRLPPSDFRLWVCLHEVTHRVQFTTNPWLVDHMASALGTLTQDAEDDIANAVGRLAAFVRDRRKGVTPEPMSSGVLGILRAIQSEPQRKALDQLLVLGTLLEGHADHVMDAVGPAVVPTVATIRERFDERRRHKQPPLQRLIRALLGFDAKISQYTRGKAFVDDVVSRVGMERFNAIWSGPETLPLPDEIDEPSRWIDRVL